MIRAVPAPTGVSLRMMPDTRALTTEDLLDTAVYVSPSVSMSVKMLGRLTLLDEPANAVSVGTRAVVTEIPVVGLGSAVGTAVGDAVGVTGVGVTRHPDRYRRSRRRPLHFLFVLVAHDA